MPKGKVIEVRPKKRKQTQKVEESSSTNATDHGKQNQESTQTLPINKSRFSKSKNRTHSGRSGSFEFPFSGIIQKRILITCFVVCIIGVTIGFAVTQYTKWYIAQLVKTPIDLPKVISQDSPSDSLFWGSYRPGLYFGMKHRSPSPLMIGLIWTVQDLTAPKYRHFCDPHDGVLSYNWFEHDGRNFGIQQIVDIEHTITVAFVKQSTGTMREDWAVRVSAVSRNQTKPSLPLSVILYFYYLGQKTEYYFQPSIENDVVVGLKGTSAQLGDHQVHFHRPKNTLQTSSLIAHIPREDKILDTMYSGVGMRQDTNTLVLMGRAKSASKEISPNVWYEEVTVQPPTASRQSGITQSEELVIEVEFIQSGRDAGVLTGASFDQRLQELSKAFHNRFQERFPVDSQRFSDRQINLSKIAVSNLLGGMGYFHGSSLIKSVPTGLDPIESWSAPLFTATPSRSIFPRGFLWDEGFHGLLLAQWDPELAMESVGHWLDLMNGEGWIPREQILGAEARSRVPEQFVVQRNTVANPPTLVLVIETLIEGLPKFSSAEATRFREWSSLVLPRLHKWYQWFNNTQLGQTSLTYRWRGRDSKEIHQLNPLTLSSGFDDYPRASHPSSVERHLDLRCWMALFARVVARLASVVTQYAQTDTGPGRLQKLEQARSLTASYGIWADLLTDMERLDKLHWSESAGRYTDYGLHTDSVRLQIPEQHHSSEPFNEDQLKPVRVADMTPKVDFLTSSFGYVNLFPLLLRLIPPDSPRVSQILADIQNRDIWTDHGIRSLSKRSPLYRKSNTQTDPPYWRGAIWLNMNYLTVRSLRYYANHPKTLPGVASEAQRISAQLSDNLVRTVLGELDRTGFLWEQYDDVTGRGMRGHPFSGWTSLVSLVML